MGQVVWGAWKAPFLGSLAGGWGVLPDPVAFGAVFVGDSVVVLFVEAGEIEEGGGVWFEAVEEEAFSLVVLWISLICLVGRF